MKRFIINIELLLHSTFHDKLLISIKDIIVDRFWIKLKIFIF